MTVDPENQHPSGVWKRTFEVVAPVERTWSAFADPEEVGKLLTPSEGSGGVSHVDEFTLLEAVPMERLSWRTDRTHPSGLRAVHDFTVTLKSTANGCTMTITRSGFGEGEDADIFDESYGQGFEHGIRDLILYVETGVIIHRHYDGCTKSALGLSYVERPAGIEVRAVGSIGVGAGGGIQQGDVITRLDGAQVFTRSDVWMFNAMREPGDEIDVEFVRDGALHSQRGLMCGLEGRLLGE